MQSLEWVLNSCERLRKLITDERKACVTPIKCGNECFYTPAGVVECTYRCRYQDNYPDSKHGKKYAFTNKSNGKGKPETPANELANASRNQLLAHLQDELIWMDEVAKEWENALKNA